MRCTFRITSIKQYYYFMTWLKKLVVAVIIQHQSVLFIWLLYIFSTVGYENLMVKQNQSLVLASSFGVDHTVARVLSGARFLISVCVRTCNACYGCQFEWRAVSTQCEYSCITFIFLPLIRQYLTPHLILVSTFVTYFVLNNKIYIQ